MSPWLPLHHPHSSFMSERAGLQQRLGEPIPCSTCPEHCTGGGEVLPQLPRHSSQVFPGCTAQSPHCQATTAAWHPSALLMQRPWERTQKGVFPPQKQLHIHRDRLHLNSLHQASRPKSTSKKHLLWMLLVHIVITEWFGLEGTFKGHLVQAPCNEQGHLQLDQAAQSPVQPDPGCLQGWGIYHCSGQIPRANFRFALVQNGS